MIKGIYSSASGMLPRILKQETFANNLANVNTPGFKKDGVFIQVLTIFISIFRIGISKKRISTRTSP
jgi:flagellar basal body rod protein FlgG